MQKVDQLYDSLVKLNPEQRSEFVKSLNRSYDQFLSDGVEACKNRVQMKQNMSIYSSLARVAFKIDLDIKRLKRNRNKSAKDKTRLKELKNAKKVLKNKVAIRFKNSPGEFPIQIVKDRYEINKNKKIQTLIDTEYKRALKEIDLSDLDEIDQLESRVFSQLGLENYPKLFEGSFSAFQLRRDKSIFDAEFCSKNEALRELKNYHSLLGDNREWYERCEIDHSLKAFSSLFNAFNDKESFLPNLSDIFSSLLNFDTKNDLIKGILGANCPEKIVKIPKTISCRDYTPGNDFKRRRLSREKINEKMRLKIHHQLRRNRPVGVGVCSLFMRKKGVDTDFGEKEKCSVDGKNRFHGMAIVGFKEVKNGLGQTNRTYLIQNSWGENCGIYYDQKKCIGKTGRFWIEEEELFPNIRTINEVYTL